MKLSASTDEVRREYFKPRKRLDYLLDLIASLDDDNYHVVKTLLEQAAKAEPPDQRTPRWAYWAAIIKDIERRREKA